MINLRTNKYYGIRYKLFLFNRSLLCSLDRRWLILSRLIHKWSWFPSLLKCLFSFQTLFLSLTGFDLLFHPSDWFLSDSFSLIKETIPSWRTKYRLISNFCSLIGFWREGLTVSPLCSSLCSWSFLYFFWILWFLFWLSFWGGSILYNLFLMT